MFDPAWLALREPADAAARSASLARSLVDALPRTEPARVLDLGAGTGANARYLADCWIVEQQWLLADIDAALLAHLPERMSAWAVTRGQRVSADDKGLRLSGGGRPECRFATRLADLATLDDSALFAGRHLVTASALLDLVSDAWLRRLAGRCRKAGASALFALTYDGGMRCMPEDPGDATIRDLVNRHQRTDKGFGPALGPDAVAAAERCFTAEGYHVRRERSDWMLSSGVSALQHQLVEGWAEAAREVSPAQAASIDDWRRGRLALVDRGGLEIVVGHQDLAAICGLR